MAALKKSPLPSQQNTRYHPTRTRCRGHLSPICSDVIYTNFTEASNRETVVNNDIGDIGAALGGDK